MKTKHLILLLTLLLVGGLLAACGGGDTPRRKNLPRHLKVWSPLKPLPKRLHYKKCQSAKFKISPGSGSIKIRG